jgi:hypothetical protein
VLAAKGDNKEVELDKPTEKALLGSILRGKKLKGYVRRRIQEKVPGLQSPVKGILTVQGPSDKLREPVLRNEDELSHLVNEKNLAFRPAHETEGEEAIAGGRRGV